MTDRPWKIAWRALTVGSRLAWIVFLGLSPWGRACGQQPHSAEKQTYVEPWLWGGVLAMHSAADLSGLDRNEPDLQLLSAALAEKPLRRPTQVVLAYGPEPATAAVLEPLLSVYTGTVIRIAPEQIGSIFTADTPLADWAQSDALWLETDQATSLAIGQLDAAAHRRLIGALEQVLDRGGLVRIGGDLTWLGDAPEQQLSSLVAGCTLTAPGQPADATAGLRLELSAGARLGLAQRRLINRSDIPVTIRLAATTHYPQELVRTLGAGESVDWVQWQRAKLERQQPVFPAAERSPHHLAGGSLVIGGGGGMPSEVWQRFVQLAGGKSARIVILPTAVDEPTDAPSLESRLLRQAGAEHLVTLPQTELSAIEDPAFLAELERATGIWFGGGRQWRFVDAYWGTRAWEKLTAVCRRGGVIGGSSAGATIQGDLLVRGAPAGNHIMIAEGYRRGLGLLPGVAIDQHFSQRNRFSELENCLAGFPAVCGIGIDEQTAVVVTASNRCEVLGNGSAWRYASYEVDETLKPDAATRARMREEYKSGSTFRLSGQ